MIEDKMSDDEQIIIKIETEELLEAKMLKVQVAVQASDSQVMLAIVSVPGAKYYPKYHAKYYAKILRNIKNKKYYAKYHAGNCLGARYKNIKTRLQTG